MTAPSQRPIEYKGEPLDAERGPGLGCFRFQLVVLVFFIILTPLTVAWRWPTWISVLLLVAVLVLLLVAGQTIIFLLRLVAADRRTRRRPLGGQTKTVGELEDEAAAASEAAGDEPAAEPAHEPAHEPGDEPGDEPVDEPVGEPADEPAHEPAAAPPNDEGPVRQ